MRQLVAYPYRMCYSARIRLLFLHVSGQKTPPELVKEIDEFQNALFKLPAFKTLETMKRFCQYAEATSDPTEFNLYSETAHLYIRIRLITRFRDYNAYIYYYDKAAAGEEQ